MRQTQEDEVAVHCSSGQERSRWDFEGKAISQYFKFSRVENIEFGD